MANLYRLVPPTFTGPSPALNDAIIAILVFIEDIWPTEFKYDEKRVIVKVVDECTKWAVLRQRDLLTS